MAEKIQEEPKPDVPSLWAQNHGNLLSAVVITVFVIGAIILLYQQSRVRKPGFPDGSSIRQVGTASPADDSAAASKEIEIIVIGAANEKGSIRIAIYDAIESFTDPSKAVIKQALPITDGQATLKIALRDLPEKFAVATFHDENDDGELNRNRVGIPSERYGFSNNARGFTGPPPYKEAEVERDRIQNSIKVSIR